MSPGAMDQGTLQERTILEPVSNPVLEGLDRPQLMHPWIMPGAGLVINVHEACDRLPSARGVQQTPPSQPRASGRRRC